MSWLIECRERERERERIVPPPKFFHLVGNIISWDCCPMFSVRCSGWHKCQGLFALLCLLRVPARYIWWRQGHETLDLQISWVLAQPAWSMWQLSCTTSGGAEVSCNRLNIPPQGQPAKRCKNSGSVSFFKIHIDQNGGHRKEGKMKLNFFSVDFLG